MGKIIVAEPVTRYGGENPPKIDDEATDGLLGEVDSLAYRVAEIERHHHNWERWFEAAATPSGETHVADRMGEGGGSFQVDAGNDDWGAWVQILGSDDTPVVEGNAFVDAHRVAFTAQERNNQVYFLQFALGVSGAAALAAGTYSEFVLRTGSGASVVEPVAMLTRRFASSTKLWARTKAPGANTGTIDFCIGVHEYEG